MNNPFFYGNPVTIDQFVDRRRELRRLVSRIANQGQSTAIVGEPRSGKTSLLHYLAAEEKRGELYGSNAKGLLFCYLDGQMLGARLDQSRFWRYALQPLYEHGIATRPESALARAFRVCAENDFGSFVLERLLAQMKSDHWRLILLLDEFDDLLHHPILNNAEFFGSLRSLASRSRGALALVIASRKSLEELNRETQEFSRSGSPYFNTLDEIVLGPLPDRDVAELLQRGGSRFTSEDRRFVMEVAGGHPYLLQLSAASLWDAYDDFQDRNPIERRQMVGQSIYDRVALTIADTWRIWAPEMRIAFTVVALAQIQNLLQIDRMVDVDRLIADADRLKPELYSLSKQGFIVEDMSSSVNWQIRPKVFLWWLVGEIDTTLRRETTFEEWLWGQKWDGLLKHGQKQMLGGAVRAIMKTVKGVQPLIEALAKGAAEGFGKALVG